MLRTRATDIRDLFRLKVVGRPAISPDGRQVAFELRRPDLAENKNFTQIMLVNAETLDCRPLTGESKHSSARPKWSPDGSKIAFLSDRDKGSCLFVLEMGGGEPRRITEPDGYVHDFGWSPDGGSIAYSRQAMNERELLDRDGKQDDAKARPQFKHITRLHHKLDGAGWWNGHYTHVWCVDLHSGRKRQLTHGEYDHSEPRFSPDGKLISFVSNRMPEPDLNFENADIYVVRPGGGPTRKVTQKNGSCAGHAWSPDGKSIAFIGNPAKTGDWWKYNERIWIVPSRGGKPREIATAIDNPCRNITLGDVSASGFEYSPPVWSADGTRLYFLVSERGACRMYSQSIADGDLRCEINGDINIYFMQRTAVDGPITLCIGTTTNPGDVYLTEQLWRQHSDAKSVGWRAVARNQAEMPKRLTHVNSAALDPLDLPAPEEIFVRNGRTTIHAWVFKPPGFSPKKRYPAILEIHGGPAAQVGCAFFHEKQLFAARGYVVVSGNPRGSLGYGLKHCNAIHADWGNKDYADISRLADWIFAQRFVDKKRVGVTGGSYGGFMTNWIVGHTNRFRAAVTQRSVVNLESMFGTSDYGYDLGHEFGGQPWEILNRYRAQSPLTYVRNIRTPLLIEHEEEDHRCPIEQAEQLFAALRVLGRTVEMVRFEGESHGLCRGGRPHNRAERLRRILDWFERYMPK
ncbi:MAG: S9 family peptidase [Planctomycetes bacterium]|nr:S9 family peptidase [Planctomycetota bacterium]